MIGLQLSSTSRSPQEEFVQFVRFILDLQDPAKKQALTENILGALATVEKSRADLATQFSRAVQELSDKAAAIEKRAANLDAKEQQVKADAEATAQIKEQAVKDAAVVKEAQSALSRALSEAESARKRYDDLMAKVRAAGLIA